MGVMVDHERVITAKKYCEHGKCGLYEYLLLCFFSLSVGSAIGLFHNKVAIKLNFGNVMLLTAYLTLFSLWLNYFPSKDVNRSGL